MGALDLFSVETEILNTLLQKLFCESSVPNTSRKQRASSIKKNHHNFRRQVKTGKKYCRHEEAASRKEKNGFRLSAVENSTEISGQHRKLNFL